MKIYSKNKRAKFDYELIKSYEAGLSLLGSEVKSIKNGDVDLSGSYVVIDSLGNAQWINGNISKYKFNSQTSHDERRTRQLLLKKREIQKLKEEVQLRRLTLIPYIIYANHKGKIKLELYVARGKNTKDKRETIKNRDLKRDNNY